MTQPDKASTLKDRCADFKDNHDMGYSVDDLLAFVLTEIDRVRSPRLPGYTQYTGYRP